MRRKVTVVVIAYNQQETISQTIESILSQKGDFELEVIVADDCSNDDTPSICKTYREQFPDTIRLLLQTSNQGITKNFIDAIRMTTGEIGRASCRERVYVLV